MRIALADSTAEIRRLVLEGLAEFRGAHPGERVSCVGLGTEPVYGSVALAVDTPESSDAFCDRYPDSCGVDDRGRYCDSTADMRFGRFRETSRADWEAAYWGGDRCIEIEHPSGAVLALDQDDEDFGDTDFATPILNHLVTVLRELEAEIRATGLRFADPLRLGVIAWDCDGYFWIAGSDSYSRASSYGLGRGSLDRLALPEGRHHPGFGMPGTEADYREMIADPRLEVDASHLTDAPLEDHVAFWLAQLDRVAYREPRDDRLARIRWRCVRALSDLGERSVPGLARLAHQHALAEARLAHPEAVSGQRDVADACLHVLASLAPLPETVRVELDALLHELRRRDAGADPTDPILKRLARDLSGFFPGGYPEALFDRGFRRVLNLADFDPGAADR